MKAHYLPGLLLLPLVVDALPQSLTSPANLKSCPHQHGDGDANCPGAFILSLFDSYRTRFLDGEPLRTQGPWLSHWSLGNPHCKLFNDIHSVVSYLGLPLEVFLDYLCTPDAHLRSTLLFRLFDYKRRLQLVAAAARIRKVLKTTSLEALFVSHEPVSPDLARMVAQASDCITRSDIDGFAKKLAECEAAIFTAKMSMQKLKLLYEYVYSALQSVVHNVRVDGLVKPLLLLLGNEPQMSSIYPHALWYGNSLLARMNRCLYGTSDLVSKPGFTLLSFDMQYRLYGVVSFLKRSLDHFCILPEDYLAAVLNDSEEPSLRAGYVIRYVRELQAIMTRRDCLEEHLGRTLSTADRNDLVYAQGILRSHAHGWIEQQQAHEYSILVCATKGDCSQLFASSGAFHAIVGQYNFIADALKIVVDRSRWNIFDATRQAHQDSMRIEAKKCALARYLLLNGADFLPSYMAAVSNTAVFYKHAERLICRRPYPFPTYDSLADLLLDMGKIFDFYQVRFLDGKPVFVSASQRVSHVFKHQWLRVNMARFIMSKGASFRTYMDTLCVPERVEMVPALLKLKTEKQDLTKWYNVMKILHHSVSRIAHLANCLSHSKDKAYDYSTICRELNACRAIVEPFAASELGSATASFGDNFRSLDQKLKEMNEAKTEAPDFAGILDVCRKLMSGLKDTYPIDKFGKSIYHFYMTFVYTIMNDKVFQAVMEKPMNKK